MRIVLLILLLASSSAQAESLARADSLYALRSEGAEGDRALRTTIAAASHRRTPGSVALIQRWDSVNHDRVFPSRRFSASGHAPTVCRTLELIYLWYKV